jgi:hypothetical protein
VFESGFKKRYGDDAKSVMYATATKLAMKKEEYLPELKASTIKNYQQMSVKQVADRNTPVDVAAKRIKNRPLSDRALEKAKKRKVVDASNRFGSNDSGINMVKNETGVTGGNVVDASDKFKKEDIDKYSIGEEGLRAWFGKSSGTTKSEPNLLLCVQT